MKRPAWLDAETPLSVSSQLRYERFLRAGAGEPPPARLLRAASAGAEGIVVRELGEVAGVSLALMDLSSKAATGTVKSLSACRIAALLRARRAPGLVVLSSGNKANSLRLYARRLGLPCVSVVPAASFSKLRAVPSGPADVIVRTEAVSDEAMKRFGRALAAALGWPCQPVVADYAASDQARAAAYYETLAAGAAPCARFYQAASSNYGLHGTYLGLERLAEAGLIEGPLPTPVAVQQTGVAPLVDVFENGLSPAAAFRRASEGYAAGRLFERTLFTTRPATLEENRRLKDRFGARFESMSRDALASRYPLARRLLARAGVRLPPRLADLAEKSGVLALAAALRAVERGGLRPGERAMIHFTGGVETLAPFDPGRAAVVDADAGRDSPARIAAAARLLV